VRLRATARTVAGARGRAWRSSAGCCRSGTSSAEPGHSPFFAPCDPRACTRAAGGKAWALGLTAELAPTQIDAWQGCPAKPRSRSPARHLHFDLAGRLALTASQLVSASGRE